MRPGNEAFSRVVIDAQLADQGWSTQDPNSVRYEYVLPDGTRADYVLSDRYGRSAAVIEASILVNRGPSTVSACGRRNHTG
ncbi:MAG: hypothetical protein ACLQJ7_06170 [Syntrophobacteraceae bacterium]